jgi:hypothetical protein
VQGDEARSGTALAVGLNGRIAGLGQTFSARGRIQVSVMVDPAAFRDGTNRLELFVVRGGALLPIRISNAP